MLRALVQEAPDEKVSAPGRHGAHFPPGGGHDTLLTCHLARHLPSQHLRSIHDRGSSTCWVNYYYVSQ